ncbi:hypothetical protein GOBAR_AA26721 [Gossypium barbadense]|uniref:Uncharacterized protein n=1 Tax=Gossypium barbadense TaxID=3634 RepID=A0A2P5WS79_GOSBA|nr:hypothetical protein GOBAR_AA26721 [Gossypium barbadense]
MGSTPAGDNVQQKEDFELGDGDAKTEIIDGLPEKSDGLDQTAWAARRFGHKSDLCPYGSGKNKTFEGVSDSGVSKDIFMKERVEVENFGSWNRNNDGALNWQQKQKWLVSDNQMVSGSRLGILSVNPRELDGNKSSSLNDRVENKEVGRKLWRIEA